MWPREISNDPQSWPAELQPWSDSSLDGTGNKYSFYSTHLIQPSLHKCSRTQFNWGVHVKRVSLFYSTSSWEETEANPQPSLCAFFLGMQTTVYGEKRHKRTWETQKWLQLVFCFYVISQLFKLKTTQTKKPQSLQQFFCYSFCSYRQWQKYEITPLKLFSLTWKQIGTFAISEILFLLIKRQFLWVTKPWTSGSKPGSLKRNLEFCKHNRQGTQLKKRFHLSTNKRLGSWSRVFFILERPS